MPGYDEIKMVHNKLSTVVKALRLRYAIPFVLLLEAVYWMGIHPWMTNWGSTAAERQMALTGDKLIPGRSGRSTLAITINATPEVIWQWLVQIGQDRAGFYSYTWRMMLPDYLGGVGKDSARQVLISEPGRALVLEMWGAHVITPIDEHTSRLIVRGESAPDSLMTTMALEPLVFTMERRMLLGLKARAEGRPDAPAALMTIAQLGWAAAGIILAGLFVSQRRRRYWLVLPVVAALPALWMSSDVQAGLAAFLATGIPVIGFLIFGRSWWGTLLVIGSVVMLTLLLAPEAYTAIGLAFAVLLLAALGVILGGRLKEKI